MQRDELAALIAEYGQLLRQFRWLTAEADALDQRLTEIERQLPDSCVGPDDPLGNDAAV